MFALFASAVRSERVREIAPRTDGTTASGPGTGEEREDLEGCVEITEEIPLRLEDWVQVARKKFHLRACSDGLYLCRCQIPPAGLLLLLLKVSPAFVAVAV